MLFDTAGLGDLEFEFEDESIWFCESPRFPSLV